MKIAVMGSGGWGTALALVLLENGHEVTLWSYREEESTILREKRENPMLKGVPLPDGLALTSDRECVKNCKVVVLATPSFAVRTTARALAQKAGVEMPITEAAYQVLYGGRDTRAVIKELMTRARKHELEDSWV